MAQVVKNPVAMWETWVLSLDWEDPWKRERPPSCILAWKIPWTVSSWSCNEADMTEQLSLSSLYKELSDSHL